MRVIIKFIYKIFILIVYNPKIVGKENLPTKSCAILCPNHVHALDSTVIISMNKRKINAIAKKELFKNGFVKYLAKVFGIYAVDTKNKDIGIVKTALTLMKKNEFLLIFPEGTRNGIAKNVKPKKGAIKIAIKSGAPIIPIGIQGNFRPFKKVKVNIGKPIDYSEYKEEINNNEKIEELLNNLMAEIIRLTNEKI